MRRGGRARRAMLGAVATGALLGAAQGFNLGWKSLLASATAQSDGEAGGYTGRAVSASSWGNRLAVGEAKADESKSQVSAEMSPVHRRRLAEDSGYKITLDTKDIEDQLDDEYTVVTKEGLVIVIGPSDGSGVYDIAPALPNSPAIPGLGLGIAVEGGNNPVTDVAGSCPGGITLDESSGEVVCYTTPARDTSVVNVGGSIVVTETSSDEKTTIAGSSNTITVWGR